MALIDCRECGKKVSTEAAACPHCGAPPLAQVRPPAPPQVESTKPGSSMSGIKLVGGSLLAFAALSFAIVASSSKPADSRLVERRKAECEAAIKSGIGYSTTNYSDKLAYEREVAEACGGTDLPYLRDAAAVRRAGCPAEAPNCSWGR